MNAVHSMNRAQRRLQRKLQRGKPAPRRQELPGAINTMEMACSKASRLTEVEISYILQLAHEGFDALRRGVGLQHHWTSLAQLVTFGVAIEASGIVKGLSEQFASARNALKAMRERVTSATPPTWGTSTAMRAEELRAVSEAIRLHRFQLEQLSAGELQRLHRIVARAEREGMHAP